MIIINFIKKIGVVIFLVVALLTTVFFDLIIKFIDNNRYLHALSQDGLASINDKIILATFFALLFYTWETRKMSLATTGLLKLEEPIIDLFFRPKTEKHEDYFRIRNTGRGVAYNLKIESDILNNKNFYFVIGDPNLLIVPEEEKTVLLEESHTNSDGGKEFQIDLNGSSLSLFFSELKNVKEFSAKIKIHYEDSSKKEYTRIFLVYYENRLAQEIKIELLHR